MLDKYNLAQESENLKFQFKQKSAKSVVMAYQPLEFNAAAAGGTDSFDQEPERRQPGTTDLGACKINLFR